MVVPKIIVVRDNDPLFPVCMHPDVFLTAAGRMGIAPNACVVIEDGVSGMEAATSAGMGCIGLVKDPLKKYPATAIVTSLADVTYSLIKSIQELHITRSHNAIFAHTSS